MSEPLARQVEAYLKRLASVRRASKATVDGRRRDLQSFARYARDSGLTQLPIVLTNHPKDIRDLPAIERFVGEVSAAEDIEFITLTEIAAKLRSGEFKIRTAG